MHYACNKNLFFGFTFALTEEGALNGAMNWTFISSRNPSFQLTDTGFPRTFFYVRAALLVTDRRWTGNHPTARKVRILDSCLGSCLEIKPCLLSVQVSMILKRYLQWDVALEPFNSALKLQQELFTLQYCHVIWLPGLMMCHNSSLHFTQPNARVSQ